MQEEEKEIFFSEDDIERVGGVLANEAEQLAARFRAVFVLRNIGGEKAIDALFAALNSSSPLLKHEIAYCVGQIGDAYAVPKLLSVLQNTNEAVIVRHECGEALGAIGLQAKEALPVLEKLRDDKNEPIEVRETCELAAARIQYLLKGGVDRRSPKYFSVDPAPSGTEEPGQEKFSASVWKERLLNTKLSLFDRYRAMFALRDIGGMEAVEGLASALRDESALLRHEIGFVFGQLQDPESAPAIIKALRDEWEQHPMVRHELIEALGSIATPDCLAELKRLKDDKDRVVSESCTVGLDMYAYETSGAFQYADTLVKQ